MASRIRNAVQHATTHPSQVGLCLAILYIIYPRLSSATSDAWYSEMWQWFIWQTWNFRQALLYSISARIAWSFQDRLWQFALGLWRALKEISCMFRKRTMHQRLSASLQQAGHDTVSWGPADAPELWARNEVAGGPQALMPSETAQFDKSGRLWRRLMSSQRGQQLVANHADTPPTSRLPTPQEVWSQGDDFEPAYGRPDVGDAHSS